MQLKDLADVLKKTHSIVRAGNHRLRMQILDLLQKNGPTKVTDIYVKLRLEQSVASQHLAILRRAGYVETERQGKFIYYRMKEMKMQQFQSYCEAIIKTAKQQ